jgi:valyl-tRNA synthetase
VLAHVLDGILRLLHPFMPFITEELWQRIPGSSGTLVLASYPSAPDSGRATRIEGVEALMDLVNRIRNLKAERGIAPGQPVELKVAPVNLLAHTVLSHHSLQELVVLARLSRLEIVETLPEGANWAPGVSSGYKFALCTPQAEVDAGAERKRLEGDLRKARAEKDKFALKLESPSFAEKAPAEVVEKTRRLLREYSHKVAELEASLGKLLS